LEKKVLAIRKKLAEDPSLVLTRKEKFDMKTYALAYKFHIVSDVSDETYRQFVTAQVESLALEESDQAMTAFAEAENQASATQK
jgi:hypothetical protein